MNKFHLRLLRTKILFITLITVSSCIFNEEYQLENRTWDVCTKNDFLGLDEECYYFITYVFKEDGTGYEFTKTAPDSIQNIQSSRNFSWKLDDNLLTASVMLPSGERKTEQEIHWVNKSCFYTIETNSLNITTEKYYFARD